MKRLLLAAIGVLVAMGAALAADAPERRLPKPRHPTYVPFFTWNGFYVGINGGYGFGRSNWRDTITGISTGDFDVNGPLFGATAGYNVQLGGFVFGAEGDFDWSNIKGSTTTNCITTCETKNNWLATARGRVGYAFDRFLPYFTGGIAFGEIKGSVAGFGSFTETRTGWTLGGGVEYAFVDRVSAKLEYLYVDLGNATCNATCSGGNPVDVSFATNVLRAGVNYRF
jgi:outer membrane immunogenic protein